MNLESCNKLCLHVQIQTKCLNHYNVITTMQSKMFEMYEYKCKNLLSSKNSLFTFDVSLQSTFISALKYIDEKRIH